MRLITFQTNKWLDSLGKDWYSTKADRIKEYDEEFIDELESEAKFPIYAFANYPTYAGYSFDIMTMCMSLTNIIGYYRFTMSQRVMIELEVPEEEILVMHEVDNGDKTVITKDYLKTVRENRHNAYEVLLPCIKWDWVVAYRKFKSKERTYDVETVRVSKIYAPVWEHEITIQGTGYPIFKQGRDDEALKMLESKGTSKHQVLRHLYGAESVPTYFTVEEALWYANGKFCKALYKLCDDANLDADSYPATTIYDLLWRNNSKL